VLLICDNNGGLSDTNPECEMRYCSLFLCESNCELR